MISGVRLAAMAAALTALGLAAAHAPATAQQPEEKAKEQAAEKAKEAPKRPQIATTKVEGTDNVYIFRNGNHQAMFVVTRQGVIATDPVAYGRPTGGQAYVDEIRKITKAPIRYLVYSHHHLDHIAGGKAFKDAGATIIAHRNARRRLAAINDPNTPLPDRVVGDYTALNLGGTTLELRYLGLNHSDSTLVMRLPREKIVFIVDTIPVGTVPGRGMIDFHPLETETFMRRVLALDWERLIPGHPGQPNDRLGTKKDVADQLKLLQVASAEGKRLGQAGRCWEPGEKEFKLEGYESWPGYANGLPFIARRYCGLWGRGT
jgi:glyoxylase-like metal-dependent hydrolase (beta-lactamase superfamily II)